MDKVYQEVEIWNVYDRDRNLTDRVHRRGEPLKEGDYHLIIHLCIFNSKGELLIQRRQPWKKGWPNMWDLSVGGSALIGENSRRAAEREAKEELGIDIDLSEYRPKFTVNFPRGFDDYWMIEKDIPLEAFKLQEEEVAEVRWVNKEQLQELVDKGIFIKYSFIDKIFELRHYNSAITEGTV